MRLKITAALAFAALLTAAPALVAQDADAQAGTVLIDEDFEEGMANWWVEGSERVRVEDGRLHVDADPAEDSDEPFVATIWCRTPISGNVRIEFDAHVISSRTSVPHINLFMFYSDPDGTPLYDTRDDRADGAYAKYQAMNGTIITYFHQNPDGVEAPREDQAATLRIRHCPGFMMLGETVNYHCRPGHTYRIEIIKRDDFIEFHADGNYLMGVHTPEPRDEGLMALRTFRTHLWWDNIRVTALD